MNEFRPKTHVKFAGLSLLFGVILSAPFLFFAVRDVIRFSAVPMEKATVSSQELIPDLPPSRTYAEPLLVLVLDVSGSMKKSDPRHNQYSAVASLLKIYRHVSLSAARGGIHPKISIILYSTVAKFLTVDNKICWEVNDNKKMNQVLNDLADMLGHVEQHSNKDPRVGFSTDHLAAAKRVADVVSALRKGADNPVSACVLFMTDGIYDPSPLFDASMGNDKEHNRNLFLSATRDMIGDRAAKQINNLFQASDKEKKIESKSYRSNKLLFPMVAIWRSLFSTNSFSSKNREKLESLLSSLPRGSKSGYLWFKEYCELGERDIFKLILLNTGIGATVGKDVVKLTNPRELRLAFAGLLSDWLDLEECVGIGDNQFVVPPGANSMTLIARAEASNPNGYLEHGAKRYALEGGLVLVSRPEPGVWKLVSKDKLTGVRVYADSRYRWIIERPQYYSKYTDAPLLKVSFYGLETRSRTDPYRIYKHIPKKVSAELVLDNSTAKYIELEWRKDENAYRNILPQEISVRPGKLRIKVRIKDLIYSGQQRSNQVVLTSSTYYYSGLDLKLIFDEGDKERIIGGIRNLRLMPGGVLDEEDN